MPTLQNNKTKSINKNLPNYLTLSRIIFVPVIMLVMCGKSMTTDIIGAAIFLLCSLTDMADGKIARKYGIVSNFGKFMDPLADKFLVIGVLLAAVLVYESMQVSLIISLTLIVFRELAVSGIRLVAKDASGIVVAAAMPGKIKTCSQCVCIMLLFLEPYIFSCIPFIAEYRIFTYLSMAVMDFFTVYSGILYIKDYAKFISM